MSLPFNMLSRDEAQAGNKIAGRNINNLRYTDDPTIMAEVEGLKSFLMKVKEEGENVGFKYNIQKTKIMTSSPTRSVQLSHSVVSDSLRPHESQHARPPCPSQTPGVLKLMPIESVMPFSHLILCHPLLLLPPIPPSIRVFSNESTLLMRWPKYWSFSFSISPSNEHPGLISFRMDWLDLLVVQGTLKSLLQHHSSKASILWHSAFFTVQLSYPYMTTGKTIALTRWTFVGKVMSLLFNMLCRLVITFLPRS